MTYVYFYFFISIISASIIHGNSTIPPVTSINCIEDSAWTDTIGYNNCNMSNNGELLILSRLIKNHDIVFDVGANVGDWSAEALQYHPQIQVYAFEPIPHLALHLQTKFSQRPVSIFEYAISCDEKKTIFNYYPNCSGLSGIYDRPILSSMTQEKFTVQTISLDLFCQRNDIKCINFLKIDTEGNELNVLLGASGLLNQQAINMIQFEYGGTYPDAGVTLKQVFAFLQSKKYEIYRITSEYLIHINQWHDSLENNQYSNYLAIAR